MLGTFAIVLVSLYCLVALFLLASGLRELVAAKRISPRQVLPLVVCISLFPIGVLTKLGSN